MKCLNVQRASDWPGNKVDFPCGRCKACRINQRREWTARLILESRCYEHSAWVTLTYRDEDLPAGGLLDKAHLRAFLKSIGKKNGWHRYMAVGEYGDRTCRPHYHCLLFGYRPRLHPTGARWCDPRIEDCWKLGGTLVEDFAVSSKPEARLAYLAAYTVKKWTKPPANGQEEFAMMSLRPGIGAGPNNLALDQLVYAMDQMPFVPRAFRHNGKLWPLSRYLRTKLKDITGKPDGPIEGEAIDLATQRTRSRKITRQQTNAARRSAF